MSSRLAARQSIRARVAFWFAVTVAILVAAFGLAGYLYLERTAIETADAELSDAAGAVVNALQLEWTERHDPRLFVPLVVREFRFRGTVVAVYDRESGALVSGEQLPDTASLESLPAEEQPAALIPEQQPPALSRPLPTKSGTTLQVPDFASHLASAPSNAVSFGTDESARPPVRWIAMPFRLGPRTLVIGALHSLGNQRRTFARYRWGLITGIPILLLLSAFGGWMLARTSLLPVASMTERAALIGATTLHERLPIGNPGDELGRLAAVFNDLLARLDQAFDQQRQFMADASHELRTPVAIISGEAELALSREDRGTAELRDALGAVRHEARRLKKIVDDLFLLARGHAGETLLVPRELYLDDVTSDCVRAVRSRAQARGIELEREEGEEMPFRGDEALLKRLLINLLDNAIKYTPAGGHVTVRERRDGEHYVISVHDSGTGIDEEARSRLFDRFYRLTRVRGEGEDPGGAGLGLAIARWIAEAHGGTLTLDATGAQGSTFALRLPAPRDG